VTLSLDLLHTFLTVYREGSLTRAAQRLSRSQPAVTAQLRAIEDAVGRPLFVRLPRGVTPTPAADLLARRVARPLDELGEVVADNLDPSTSFRGVVHLGGPVEYLTARGLPAIAGLVAAGLQVRVTLGVADELIRGLRSGAVDLAVVPVRPRDPGLRWQPFYDEEFVLVAADAWTDRIAAGPDLPTALATVPLVTYAENLPIVRRYWQTIFSQRPTRDAALVVANLHAVLAAVRAGAGISVLPSYLCATDLDAGRLVAVHNPPTAPLNTLYLASRAGAPPTAAVTAVHERLLADARAG
jgi:DNA-binding transcriptional LysR family regulator